MPHVLAILVTDLERGRLGLPSMLARELAGKSVLRRTVERVARVPGVEKLVLLHPAGQDPRAALGAEACGKPIEAFADPAGLDDPHRPLRTAARKWSPHAWRGGLGGATCYDELLPASPILAALKAQGGDAALLLGGDWPLVDPGYCQRLIDLHLEAPDAMQLAFTQAPPGLAGVVAGTELLGQLASVPSATFGQILGYVPSRPQPDPIGRDVCVQIEGRVRSCARRFICDTPRSAAMLDAIAARLGDRLDGATPESITAAAEDAASGATRFAALPQQVTLELTPQRAVSGPIVPQHYVTLNRSPMKLDAALRIVERLGTSPAGDIALTLGGLGDALLYEGWDRVVAAAHAAGVFGICLETDLLVDEATLHRIVELPVDVLSLRINADRAATYQKVMGSDRFAQVIQNMQTLFKLRQDNALRVGMPWMAARLVKTADTLEDLEGFFDKWVHYLGAAVIEPATTGCGLAPALSPVNMAPPCRRACRQLGGRMTVLSDGRVAQCDQDWLGRATAGSTEEMPLSNSWEALQARGDAHAAGKWDEVALCGACQEWHRP